jgi:hypothetical protein
VPYLLFRVPVAGAYCNFFFFLFIFSKSEFVVYKLKEMGKISEKDVMLICEQFERLDSSKCGKITLSALIDSHHLNTNNSSARHNYVNLDS